MFRLTTFEFALQYFSPAVGCTAALASAAAIGRAAQPGWGEKGKVRALIQAAGQSEAEDSRKKLFG